MELKQAKKVIKAIISIQVQAYWVAAETGSEYPKPTNLSK